MRTLLIALSLILFAAPASAQLLATYSADVFWHQGSPTPAYGGIISVERGSDLINFGMPALAPGTVSRYTGLDLSTATDTDFRFWISSLGYSEGGFVPSGDSSPPLTLEQFRTATTAELQVTKWTVTNGPICVDCGPGGTPMPEYYIADFEFNFHLYHTPEPASFTVMLLACCVPLRCRRH